MTLARAIALALTVASAGLASVAMAVLSFTRVAFSGGPSHPTHRRACHSQSWYQKSRGDIPSAETAALQAPPPRSRDSRVFENRAGGPRVLEVPLRGNPLASRVAPAAILLHGGTRAPPRWRRLPRSLRFPGSVLGVGRCLPTAFRRLEAYAVGTTLACGLLSGTGRRFTNCANSWRPPCKRNGSSANSAPRDGASFAVRAAACEIRDGGGEAFTFAAGDSQNPRRKRASPTTYWPTPVSQVPRAPNCASLVRGC